MEIVYRTALADDSEEIARLSSQLGYPAEAGQVRERVAFILANGGNALYVAEREGKLVGWVHAHGRHLIESAPFAEIGGLVVDSDCRGQGIGKQLVNKCEEWARTAGFGSIRVRTNAARLDAPQFYARIGYKTVKSQQVFQKEISP
ncbi:GNAT family acetyltransferase [Gordoniibacillus kamchatkensis]|uniref:GNAT family acetyltransferase n=1 Tax=Gordoniibacillus kamchatkensis TaxID=1590651 RepID=A0ABR5AAH8_9BACL|nr:GNAT family N-acetyltransferase [Paenibacillus sp. VKM B-2647]KIL38034.1 GNAT family acetyltransferase [Paenibacillus sp. VKM B-2647]